jgi:hypothetical protein
VTISVGPGICIVPQVAPDIAGANAGASVTVVEAAVQP